MAKLSNPIAFTRGPVTVFTVLIYLAIIVSLIVVQTGVPSFPKSATPLHGINLTEAWLDLQHLTASYHPYNSRKNDEVHDWLLSRIESILNDTSSSPNTFVFDDDVSNLTFSSLGSTRAAATTSVYFEGKNIILYVRGSADDTTEWWKDPKGQPSTRNGVLVNAHYDSVSTGFGATDDGVGVISVLQLLKYYTTKGNQPKNGIVFLLNNGEEDFLNGARVFAQHPISKLVSTFLNLEGAGAGGRAVLFRSTDTEVTKAYGDSPYPFGSVISGDGFNRGLIKSQTDYVIFNGVYGYRGLDVAFFEPRARYHSDQDDARHTGKQSLWHMLSAAVATTKTLTSKSFSTNLDPNDNPGTSAVWFDLFGRRFVAFQTHTLFALSVTLLVIGPMLLLLTLALLYRADKLYLFSRSRDYHMPDGDEAVPLNGWRGFFRFPLVLLCACAAPVALAYLLFKENEFIAHSSEWAVWSMMISSFIFVAWFICRVADFARPSALTRAYGLSWMCAGWWTILVAATVLEEELHLAGTYFVLFYAATVFAATFVSYVELFSLPKKSKYCLGKVGESAEGSRSRSGSRRREDNRTAAPGNGDNAETTDDDEPTERSGLLQSRGRSAFKKYVHQSDDEPVTTKDDGQTDSHEEQGWARSQWTWLWLVQIVILGPLNLVLVGQIALTIVSALHQTGGDGSSMFLVYIAIAIFTILLFSPLVPFIHRFSWQVPIFLLLVLIGTLTYNLVAFPFSAENRLKLFFQQEVDLDRGVNTVSVIGITPFVEDMISTLPSSAGQSIECAKAEAFSNRKRCSWHGLAPQVTDGRYKRWVHFNVSKTSNSSDSEVVRFIVSGSNTRACKIVFDTPISSFKVLGQAPPDKRMKPVGDGGSKEILLWSRTWNRTWTVDATWQGEAEQGSRTGKVVCMWSDANQIGVIPAFDEARHYAPVWVAVTKYDDGLVEGYKNFKI